MEPPARRLRPAATLPMDLVLEIIARSDDVATVVRCAMSSKTLLRAMLDFLGDRAKANGGFDPSLLTAASYRLTTSHITGTGSAVVQPPGGLRRFDTDLLADWSSEPTSSRDGLLVLFQHKRVAPGHVVVRDGILVANTITGGVTSLPSMGPQRAAGSTTGTGTSSSSGAASMYTYMYRPALLSVAGAGRSFELLAMYYPRYQHGDWGQLGAQIFSSREREHEWGAVREIHIRNMPPLVHRLREGAPTAPAVVGRTVHWLCRAQQLIKQKPDRFADRDLVILALHAESAQATVIKLPQELRTRMGSPSDDGPNNISERLILASTTTAAQGEERRLSLVVAETLVISTWTLVAADEGEGSRRRSSSSWSRQVVIRRREIGAPLAYVLDAYQPIGFCMFGERSGTVLFWMQRIGLVQLNLGTKKALVLCRDNDVVPRNDISQALLHEINLVSILRCMEESF